MLKHVSILTATLSFMACGSEDAEYDIAGHYNTMITYTSGDCFTAGEQTVNDFTIREVAEDYYNVMTNDGLDYGNDIDFDTTPTTLNYLMSYNIRLDDGSTVDTVISGYMHLYDDGTVTGGGSMSLIGAGYICDQDFTEAGWRL